MYSISPHPQAGEGFLKHDSEVNAMRQNPKNGPSVTELSEAQMLIDAMELSQSQTSGPENKQSQQPSLSLTDLESTIDKLTQHIANPQFREMDLRFQITYYLQLLELIDHAKTKFNKQQPQLAQHAYKVLMQLYFLSGKELQPNSGITEFKGITDPSSIFALERMEQFNAAIFFYKQLNDVEKENEEIKKLRHDIIQHVISALTRLGYNMENKDDHPNPTVLLDLIEDYKDLILDSAQQPPNQEISKLFFRASYAARRDLFGDRPITRDISDELLDQKIFYMCNATEYLRISVKFSTYRETDIVNEKEKLTKSFMNIASILFHVLKEQLVEENLGKKNGASIRCHIKREQIKLLADLMHTFSEWLPHNKYWGAWFENTYHSIIEYAKKIDQSLLAMSYYYLACFYHHYNQEFTKAVENLVVAFDLLQQASPILNDDERATVNKEFNKIRQHNSNHKNFQESFLIYKGLFNVAWSQRAATGPSDEIKQEDHRPQI